MKRKGTIQRHLTAMFLLLLFLSIHVVKFVHEHRETSTTSYELIGMGQVEKSADCATCDYHFSNEANPETFVLATVVQKLLPIYQIPYQRSITSSIGLNYADRGPPATTR